MRLSSLVIAIVAAASLVATPRGDHPSPVPSGCDLVKMGLASSTSSGLRSIALTTPPSLRLTYPWRYRIKSVLEDREALDSRPVVLGRVVISDSGADGLQSARRLIHSPPIRPLRC